MLTILIAVIHMVSQALVIVVIVDIILSYFLSPFHSIRIALDRFVQPMLLPIRRLVPPIQMFDFSPLVLILIIQLLDFLITSGLRAI